jgi:hypothetical protein
VPHSTLGSLLLLFLAGLLAFLWIRGYLSRWLGQLTTAVQTPPPLNPVNVPGAASLTFPGGGGRPLGK